MIQGKSIALHYSNRRQNVENWLCIAVSEVSNLVKTGWEVMNSSKGPKISNSHASMTMLCTTSQVKTGFIYIAPIHDKSYLMTFSM